MLVILYTNTSENYRLDKTIQSQGSFSCTLKEGCSVENPVILLSSNVNLAGINYMFIQEFQRYYYIGDIVSVHNGLWEVHGHVDVLMTYKDGIKACQATFKRQENLFNMYLDDPEFHTYNKSQVVTKVFSGGSGNLHKGMSYVLVVSGG